MLLQRIKCSPTDRTRHVVVEGVKSISVKVSCGVPQDTALDQILLIIYMNDVTDSINTSIFAATTESLHSNIRNFADDSKLQKIINKVRDQTCLQLDVLAVMLWAEKNNIMLNEETF